MSLHCTSDHAELFLFWPCRTNCTLGGEKTIVKYPVNTNVFRTLQVRIGLRNCVNCVPLMTARLQESYRTFFTDCGETRAIQLRLRARLFGHLWAFIGILPDAYGDDTILNHLGGGWVRKIFSNKRNDFWRRIDHWLCVLTEITRDMLMPFNALSLAGIWQHICKFLNDPHKQLCQALITCVPLMTARLQESYRTFFTDCGETRAIQLPLFKNLARWCPTKISHRLSVL